jgi:hypothetical protein
MRFGRQEFFITSDGLLEKASGNGARDYRPAVSNTAIERSHPEIIILVRTYEKHLDLLTIKLIGSTQFSLFCTCDV